MGFDLFDIGNPQWLVVGKVRLLDSTAVQGDLVAHRMTNAIADATLDLGFDHVRVHRNAAVHGSGDLFDHYPIVQIARKFHHLAT